MLVMRERLTAGCQHTTHFRGLRGYGALKVFQCWWGVCCNRGGGIQSSEYWFVVVRFEVVNSCVFGTIFSGGRY